MNLEPLLSFLLLLHLRKTLKTFSPHPVWEQRLKQGMIAVGVLLVLDAALPIEFITQWIWHLAVLGIIYLAFREPLFYPTRMTMYAVLPLAVISMLSSAIVAILPDLRRAVDKYEDFAFLVAFTWLIALLILSRKGLKALKEEHQKRLEEEEQHRILASRKAELEILVTERTAELVQQKDELHHALEHLKSTQAQLVQREKMASLGELTAGIAHEIKNPLNFVNNFSELSVELANEIRQQINQSVIGESEKEDLLHLLHDLIENQKKIHYHGMRADAIVKNMLVHSQKSSGQRELININALADEYLRLTYHGIRAKDKSFTASIHTSFDESVGKINVVPQDIGRVLLNLFNNAFYAVQQKKKVLSDGYEPAVTVSTQKANGSVLIRVKDNGTGIPQQALKKVFQPFFTTKPTGEGTGLGLSLSYDIITKGHGGELKVETKEGEGAEFVVELPLKSEH